MLPSLLGGLFVLANNRLHSLLLHGQLNLLRSLRWRHLLHLLVTLSGVQEVKEHHFSLVVRVLLLIHLVVVMVHLLSHVLLWRILLLRCVLSMHFSHALKVHELLLHELVLMSTLLQFLLWLRLRLMLVVIHLLLRFLSVVTCIVVHKVLELLENIVLILVVHVLLLRATHLHLLILLMLVQRGCLRLFEVLLLGYLHKNILQSRGSFLLAFLLQLLNNLIILLLFDLMIHLVVHSLWLSGRIRRHLQNGLLLNRLGLFRLLHLRLKFFGAILLLSQNRRKELYKVILVLVVHV